MSSRPPSINPPRSREIVRLQRLLTDLDDIPNYRRVDELADERSETVRTLIAEQQAGLAGLPEKGTEEEHQYHLPRSAAGELGAVWLWLLPLVVLFLVVLSIFA